MTATRYSPFHDEHQLVKERLGVKWIDVDGMAVPLRLWDARREQELLRILAMTDASFLSRTTIKGPRAIEWLARQGLSVPSRTYGVGRTANGGVIVRTGGSEVFLEDIPLGRFVDWIRRDIATAEPGAYGVLRQDASIVFAGEKVEEMFRHVSSFDFTTMADEEFVFTQVAGVSCSILRESVGGRRQFRLWTDGTFGAYTWHTLLEVVRELGGGAVGVETFFPAVV